ncbi:MAG: hypothetical protein KDE28_29360, partial [Anaerolineales bacterium]|nr:hypothetical protein [Anaerolineales bacterium]
MNCPLCQKPITTIICPNCNASGDQAAWLRLHQLAFIRQEIAGWPRLGRSLQTTLSRHYEEAQHAIEISLGLRQAPPTIAEAKTLEQELAAVRLWLLCLTSWEKRGWLTAGFAGHERGRAERRNSALLARLHQATYWPAVTPRQRKQRDLDNFVQFLERIDQFLAAGQIEPDEGRQIDSWLKGEIAALKQELEPRPQLRSRLLRPAQPKAAPVPNPAPVPKPANTVPWTWDRLWETLLSERTLQAILFLGALLVVAAGISWVAWNWETFSPPLQVGILAAGTTAFFAAGWYVHNHLALRGSGVALFGVGALLVPLDIYALYLSGLFPAGSFPGLWWAGSATCLVLYFLVGQRLQAPFFGYLLAAAAGSLAVATLNLWPGQLMYWSPVTMAVALLLVLTGWHLGQAGSQHRTAFLSAPFYHSALGWAVAVLLVGTVFEGVYGGYRPDDLILLTLNFALGAMIFAGGRSRYRWLSLLGAALLTLPLAGLWLGLWLANQAPAAWPWLGPVWAGLTVAYLLTAWRWPSLSTAERRLFNSLAALLGPAALAWSLGNLLPATYTLLILATTGPLLARARARASWFWLLTLGLLLAGATYQGHRGVTAAALALPWALLASLLFATAVSIRQLRPTERITLAHGSFLAAFLAILPPVVLADHPLMIYTVANGCGLALWHILQPQVNRNSRTAGLAHWGLAGGILLELWLLATRSGTPQAQPLALAYAILAWSYLA